MASFLLSQVRRDTSTWQLTYSSLLTAVLAFFIMLVIKSENEAASTFKFADRLKSQMYRQIVHTKRTQNLDWLYVENTGTKGIKLLIPTQVHSQVMFHSGEATINSSFDTYLRQVSSLLNDLKIGEIKSRYAANIKQLHSLNKDINIQVRVEGHSDRLPIHTARFADNWELSTARAYSVMEYLQRTTSLPPYYFSLSGYGSFHPFRNINNLAENRRVEIYLDIQMVEANGTSKI